jgi:hypothetical protein
LPAFNRRSRLGLRSGLLRAGNGRVSLGANRL